MADIQTGGLAGSCPARWTAFAAALTLVQLACAAQALEQVTRQAEDASRIAAPVETALAGYRGSGYVNVPASGGSATWTDFDGGPGGGVNIQIRYQLAGTLTREAPLTVNGVTRRVRFAPTGSGVWGTVTAFGWLAAGETNAVTLSTDGADIGAVDEITVSQPAPVRVPARVYWGGYKNMSQLVGAGTSQWTWVQAHQDGLLLHGAYWGNPAMLPAPSNVAPALAALLAPRKPHYIYEAGFPGEYPRIDTALGTSNADAAIQDIDQLKAWGFSQPDVSTDYHMFAWQESMRYHPEWGHDDFFAALCGNWSTYTGVVVSAGTYGWYRQWTEKLAQRYAGIRVTACDSPVYFSWNDLRELGDGNNAYEAWVKLERRGTNVTALWSATGKSWLTLGVTTSSLPAAAYAGLAVTSRNNARLAAAAFGSAQVYNYFFDDVGRPGRGGSLSTGSGTFTLTSYGDNSNGTDEDAHFFVYREQAGDGAFVARVASLTNNASATRAETSAGLELRESLAANARVVSLSLRNDNKVQFQTRTSAGGALATVASPAASEPAWLKLVRSGNSFSAWISTNGTSYAQVGTTQTVALASATKLGLFCDSGVYWEDAAAQFSHVDFLDATAHSASWSGRDIGAPGVAGSHSGTSTITVEASGADIGGASDQFRFVYKPLTGDGTVLGQCSTFADKASPATALDALAKMGVMLRASTNANARHAAAVFTPQQGIRHLSRAADGAPTATGGVWGVGEAAIVPSLTGARRALAHYLTGNDFFAALRDAFPSTYKTNGVGFTTDSPYRSYMCWGGSETHGDAQKHRQKIRLYEAWLQANGMEHQLIANSNVGGATGTQAERDAWDSDYADESLRSIALHQLEGGRPDRVIFESWYDGPYTLVPETKSGSFANLALRGLKYLKGEGQTLDLTVKANPASFFFGGGLQQSVPAGEQARSWRAATTNAAQTFTVRLRNAGEVEALPVLHAYASGGEGWTVSYFRGTTNVTALMTASEGYALTDSAVQGQELIASNAAVELTVQVAAASPVAARTLLLRAFWNPQDPNLEVKDALRLDLLPPNTAPSATNSFATVAPGGSVDVDLWPLASDTETPASNLWFAVTGAANGTAVLLADGHTVRFTPAAGYNGPATFSYTARDESDDARLLRHYDFEPPDTVADALATDQAGRSDGALLRVGAGAYAYEANAPLRRQAQSLRLVEVSAGTNAELRTALPVAELNLTNASWTMSMWLKRAARNTTDMAFYIGSGNGSSGDGHELELWGGANEDRLNLRYWDAANTQRAMFSSPATVTTGTWHHASVVWAAAGGGAGTLALYADGSACGSTNLTAGFKQAQDLIWGGIASSAADARELSGWVDECALYSAALGADEVARLAQMPVRHNAGLACGGSVTINVDDSANELLARWPFDGVLADVTGHGWNLASAGDAAPTAAAYKQGSHSLALDGAGDYVYTAPLPLGSAFTLATWIYVPSNAPNIQTVAANSGGGNASGFRFYVNGYNSNPGDGKLVLETANGSVRLDVASAAGAVAKDRWQHVAAVVNRAAGTATLYRNGTAVGGGSIRTDFTNTTALYLGGMSGNTYPFRSNLDDVRAYGRALTSNELAVIVNAVNAPPALGDVTNRAVAVNAGTGAVGFTVSDDETAPQHLALAANSSDTGLVRQAAIVFGGSGANRTVTVTPVSNRLGSAVITLTVSDGTRAANDAFTVTVAGTSQEAWRFDRFGTTANSGAAADGANPDGDDWDNAQEYVLGTDPWTLSPGLTVDSATVTGGCLRVTFYTRQASGVGYAGLSRRYDVESAAALSDSPWFSVAGLTGLVGSNRTVTVNVPFDGPRRFYQLKVRLQ